MRVEYIDFTRRIGLNSRKTDYKLWTFVRESP